MNFGVFKLINLRKATKPTGVGRGRKRAPGTQLWVVPNPNSGHVRKYYFSANAKDPRFRLSNFPAWYAAHVARNTHPYQVLEGKKLTLPGDAKLGTVEPTHPAPPVEFDKQGQVLPLNQTTTNLRTAVTTEAAVENKRMKAGPGVKTEHLRIGESIGSTLDKDGYQQAKQLRALADRIAELKARKATIDESVKNLMLHGSEVPLQLISNQSTVETHLHFYQQEYDSRLLKFNKRPLATKLLRIVALEDAIEKLRAEGRKWMSDPANAAEVVKMKERYEERLKKVTRLNKKLEKLNESLPKKDKKQLYKVPKPPRAPHEIRAQILELKEKLHNLRGFSVSVEQGLPKVGEHRALVIKPSKEVAGLSPQDGPLAYKLTTGGGPIGTSGFSEAEEKAVWDEFGPIMRRYVRGRAFGTHAAGWASVLDLKTFAKDLESKLTQVMFRAVREYTPAMAKYGRSIGKNFVVYLQARLDSEARNMTRDAARHARRLGRVDDETANNIIEATQYSEAGEWTSQMLRDVGLPLASGYASAEDLHAIDDFKSIVAGKLGPLVSTGLLSVLNIHEPMQHPDGPAGSKSWDSAARDVARTFNAGKPVGQHKSPLFIKRLLQQRIGDLFRGLPREGQEHGYDPETKKLIPMSRLPDWIQRMTKDERVGFHDGLKALIRLVEARQASIPGTDSWRVVKEPEPAKPGVNPKPGVSEPAPTHAPLHHFIETKDTSTLQQQVEAVRRHITPRLHKLKEKHAKLEDAASKPRKNEPHEKVSARLYAMQAKHRAMEADLEKPLRKLESKLAWEQQRQHIRENIQHPEVGHSASVPLIVTTEDAKGELPMAEVHKFWQSQRRQHQAAHLDPAAELDLAMDLGSSHSTTGVKVKQLRARQYAAAWKKLSKLSTPALAKVAASKEFKTYETAWMANANVAATAGTSEAWKEAKELADKTYAREVKRVGGEAKAQALRVAYKKEKATYDKEKKAFDKKFAAASEAEKKLLQNERPLAPIAPPMKLKFKAPKGLAERFKRKPFRYRGVVLEHILPEDITKMTALLVQQRKLDADVKNPIKKSDVDDDIVVLLMKLRSYFPGA